MIIIDSGKKRTAGCDKFVEIANKNGDDVRCIILPVDYQKTSKILKEITADEEYKVLDIEWKDFNLKVNDYFGDTCNSKEIIEGLKELEKDIKYFESLSFDTLVKFATKLAMPSQISMVMDYDISDEAKLHIYDFLCFNTDILFNHISKEEILKELIYNMSKDEFVDKLIFYSEEVSLKFLFDNIK